MFNKQNLNENEKKLIEKLISKQEIEDLYILDNENAIIVIENKDKSIHKEYYVMIHLRLQNKKLIEINRWYPKSYYFGSIHQVTVLNDLELFQVQNGCGDFDGLYDYINGKFIVPCGIWHTIEFLKKYNSFLAYFSISSDYENDDVYSYNNPITGKKMVKSFGVRDDNYYAILNIDGTIRGNKLFKGRSLEEITKIIDLNEYETLDDFKKEREQLCNKEKQKHKQEYYELIKSRNNGSISPYLDDEVVKILNFKK